MKVNDVAKGLDLRIFAGEKGLDHEVTGGYTSDLLSDVMGHADAGKIWITIQTHKNIMAIASLKDIAAIIIIAGEKPGDDTIELSNIEGIPILGTSLRAFEISGKLFNLLGIK